MDAYGWLISGLVVATCVVIIFKELNGPSRVNSDIRKPMMITIAMSIIVVVLMVIIISAFTSGGSGVVNPTQILR